MLEKNIGKLDKSLRIFLGVFIIVLGYLNQSWWGAVGIIPILTAVISWCPFYVTMGISTIFKTKEP